MVISFTGKTVLITGGGAGIGRACAEGFGAAGARVAVAELDPARAQDVRQALEA
ncbi:SDR family NAD(P)-dependent oxidoreductase, partial [Burkholderia diffusa]|uniref:SDR family NAD(P)-dependent oxidoreductase n=1 Tax=Burkholderia diffusa TaxID=488732 RepID=UPI003D160306